MSNFVLLIIRGYQRLGENITNGKPDMQEAIDVSLFFFLYF